MICKLNFCKKKNLYSMSLCLEKTVVDSEAFSNICQPYHIMYPLLLKHDNLRYLINGINNDLRSMHSERLNYL